MPPKPGKSSPRNSAASDPQRSHAISLGRHARKCFICNHPDREAIDDEFTRWRDADSIRCEYLLPDRSCLYRHAKALGLIARRRRNLRGVAERILEHVDNSSTTASAVLRAMRLFAHISENGEWLEPPKRTIVTHVHSYALPAEAPVPASVTLSPNVPAPVAPNVTAPPSESDDPFSVVYPSAFRRIPSDHPFQDTSAPGSFEEFADELCKHSKAASASSPTKPPQNQPAAQTGQAGQNLPKRPEETQQPMVAQANSKNSAEFPSPAHEIAPTAPNPSKDNPLQKPKRPFQEVILIATPNPSRENAND